MDNLKDQGYMSNRHKEMLVETKKKFGGEIVVIRGSSNIKGKYFPDLTIGKTDIECEVLPKEYYIKNKINKWNKKRKKILVCGFPKLVLENFDEIWIISKNKSFVKVS